MVCVSNFMQNLKIRPEVSECGAMKNEYTPIIHNAGKKYARVSSVAIVERF